MNLGERATALLGHVARHASAKRVTDDELFYLFRNAGVPRAVIRDALLERARAGRVRFPAITHMELFLTEACNLKCKYCFVEGKNTKNRMTVETACKALDFLVRESRDAPRIDVTFFGGEPLLEFELIRSVVEHAERVAVGKTIRFDITSNGLLIDEERAAFLAEHRVHVLLSMDGDQETHDTYRRTMGDRPTFQKLLERMKILKRHQRYIGAKLTVMPEFGAIVDGSVRGLYESGVNHFIVGYATGVQWTREQSEGFAAGMTRIYDWWRRLPPRFRPTVEFIDEARRAKRDNLRHTYGCRAGRNGIVVNCREAIYPCSKMLGANGLTGILPLGTLSEGITELETRLTLSGHLPVDRPGCWSCLRQTSCMGGCYAVNYTTTGDPFTSGPECKMVAALDGVTAYIREQERSTRSTLALGPSVFV